MTGPEHEKMKAWVTNWKQTGEELDRVKWDELRTMDAASGIKLATMALSLADSWRSSQPVLVNRPSGLVEQQFWFAKWRSPLI